MKPEKLAGKATSKGESDDAGDSDDGAEIQERTLSEIQLLMIAIFKIKITIT